MKLVVMGVSGCGKSSLGAALAEQLGMPFFEGDALHPAANVEKMRSGIPLTDDDRWPWLTSVAQSLGERESAIVSCSALKRSYRDRLSAASHVPLRFILLETRQEELTRRLVATAGHYMPASLLESQLAILEPPGADECALTLEATTAPDALCNLALAWLRTNSTADGERAG